VRGRPLPRSKVHSRRSKVPDGWRPRPVRIHNGHPRLQIDRRAVLAAIHCLDSHAAEILGQRVTRRFSNFASPSSKALATADRSSTTPGVPPGELSVAFLTDAALARLHAAFLGDKSPTDVISFAGMAPAGRAPFEPELAGEICVSADAARTFAVKHGRDFSGEMTLYLTHGWLHLAGHDDLTPAAKKRMRIAETRAMTLLRERRLIPQFALPG
jgi:probable rRNA maturation factor